MGVGERVPRLQSLLHYPHFNPAFVGAEISSSLQLEWQGRSSTPPPTPALPNLGLMVLWTADASSLQKQAFFFASSPHLDSMEILELA